MHANGRAGITILGPASGNTVDSNDATGNGLLNIAPTLVFDLFAVSPAANVWRNNQGTANFTQSAQAQSGAMTAIAMEAFGPGGCLSSQRLR